MAVAGPERRVALPEWLERGLHDPVKVRFGVALLLFAGWYLAGYAPIESRIEETKRQMAAERELLALAEQIESLRWETGKVLDRLPAQADRSAWQNQLLQGIRDRPIRLVSIDPKPSKTVGPHEAAAALIVVEGTYEELDQFLRWIEIGPDLQRIESFELIPARSNDPGAWANRQLKITVLKIMK